MQWVRLWRYLTGYVRFTGEGGFPERFLTEAAAAGLTVTDSYKQGERLYASCPARQYRQLRPLARRACMRLRICKKGGVYFRLYPYRKRAGIPVGLLLASLLLLVLSRRIWVVQAEGNAQISAAAITEAVAAYGVYPGCRLDALNLEEMRIAALQALPKAVYVSVNPHGCVARVAVKEREQRPEIQNFHQNYSNLVAARDGTVLSVKAYSGQATVTAGEGVTAGTLLVSGTVESVSGNVTFCRAVGEVLAETERTVSICVPFRQTRSVPAGSAVFRPSLQFLRWEIPLYDSSRLDGTYAVSVCRRLPHSRAVTVPFGIIERTYTPLGVQTVQYTAEQAALLAQDELAAALRDLQTAGVEVSAETARTVTADKDGYRLCVSLRCTENIAAEVPLRFSENFS